MSGVDFLSQELYLPRNLIDDLQLASWDEALRLFMQNEVVLVDELDLIAYE